MSELKTPAPGEVQETQVPVQETPAETTPESAQEASPSSEIPAPPPSEEPKRNRYAVSRKKKGMPKWLKIGIPLVLVAASAFGIWSVVKKLTAGQGDNIIEATAMSGPLASYITGWGSIAPTAKAEYGADLKGEILEVFVAPGSIVKKGDLLFTIDPSEMKPDLLKAKEELAKLERDLRDLDKNTAKALEDLNEAQKKLNQASLSAPISGTVISLAGTLPKVGDSLSSGTVLGVIADDSNMLLSLYFNRSYLETITVGQSATISVPDVMAQLPGTVDQIDDIEKPIDGAMCFRVKIKIQNPGSLTEGQLATGVVSTSSGDVMPTSSGALEYYKKENITFEGVTAKVTSVVLKEFGKYTSGQSLITVDAAPARDALEDAQFTYEGFVRQQTDNYIQRDIDEAQKKVTELEEIVNNSSCYSTIDGQVTAVIIEPGDKLTASDTPILTISDTSSLIVKINISEMDISKVSVGMPVELSYDGGMAAGKITYLSFEAQKSQTDPYGGGGAVATFPATVTVEEGGNLLPGMSINYSIVATMKDFCLMLPSQCIVNTESGPVVYVKKGQDFQYEEAVLAEGTVPEGYYAVAVEIGVADAQNTEIVSGIEEGTVVFQAKANSDQGYWY